MALSLLAVEPLFASPLLRFRLPDAAGLNARLLGEIAELRRRDPGIVRSNRRGWHSSGDFFALDLPACRELGAQLAGAIREATVAVSPRFDFARWECRTEGWINALPPGGFNAPHDHPSFSWSGAYYVAVPPPRPDVPDSGVFEVFDPRNNARVPVLEGAVCFHDARRITPTPGDLLIFPAFLRHWVAPNDGPGERVSVAFNARYMLRRPQ